MDIFDRGLIEGAGDVIFVDENNYAYKSNDDCAELTGNKEQLTGSKQQQLMDKKQQQLTGNKVVMRCIDCAVVAVLHDKTASRGDQIVGYLINTIYTCYTQLRIIYPCMHITPKYSDILYPYTQCVLRMLYPNKYIIPIYAYYNIY